MFEKNSEVGGRCATVNLDGYVFDTGATSINPRGRELEPVMLEELDTADLVEITKPIYTHIRLRVAPGDKQKNLQKRYTYRQGNQHLATMLAADLDVKLDSKVEEFSAHISGYEVMGEDFDAVIISIPTPSVAKLLATAKISRPVSQTHFRPCLSVLLGYSHELHDLPYHAIIDIDQRHPLTWLSIESEKSPFRAPSGSSALVAQLGPQYSGENISTPDEGIISSTIEYISRLYGTAFEKPVVSQVVRWKFSQPENVTMFDSVNPKGSKVLIAGDGLLGGRTEYAYATGVKAAKMLLAEV